MFRRLTAESIVPQHTMSTALGDPIARHTLEWKLHWLLRLALCGEFVGHGAFGVLTKASWLDYFAVFGIPDAWAWRLMPVVGSVDIALGTLTLVAPTRAGLLYMSCWGFFTALLRPLAGEGWWEFLERSYNFGVPWLMLYLHGWSAHATAWVTPLTTVPRFTVARAQTAQRVLRGIIAGMLIGHGGLAVVMDKPNLIQLYTAVGLGGFGVPVHTLSAVIGGFEMLLGVGCFVVNGAAFFLGVAVWKLGTEWLYVPAQACGAWWEVMERSSSYAAPLVWIGLHTFLKRAECPLDKQP